MISSASEVNMATVGGVTRIGQGAMILGAGLFHDVNVSTILVVAGVVIWALATWRKDTREVLRRQNEDLIDRNQTLEAEKVEFKAKIAALEARPDLRSIADELDELSQAVRANTAAVQLWATARAHEV